MASTTAALQLHDARPFFEKALVHGVQQGILDANRLSVICADAPKGMVQIARYFGSEFLRPELEKARDRMVNLISLYLLDTTDGDLTKAAISLRDHSFLSRSKGGSDMLKRLIAMPESSNFGMAGYADAQTPLLALWSLRSYTDYQAELARRSQIAHAIRAAQWLAEQFELDTDELEAAGADAEAVIRTGLLMQALAPKAMQLGEWPNAVALEKLVTALRKKKLAAPKQLLLPAGLPADLRAVMQTHCASVLADLPKLLDATNPLRSLLRPTGAFRARYFLLDDPLAEVGLKDITAHVNFTGTAVAAQEAGFEVLGYTSQAHFLINCGLGPKLDALAQGPRAMATKLMMEHEMGELFKVIGLAKGVEPWDAMGFVRGDRTHRL